MKKFISLFMSSGVVIAITLLISPSVALAVPVVDAGPDEAFSLPRDFTVLAGSASDPVGILFVSWTSTGPNSPNIVDPGTLITNVNGLVAGTYVFRLTVFNSSFQSNFDEVTVTVLPDCPTCEFGWPLVSTNSNNQGGAGECRSALIDCNFTGPIADCVIDSSTPPSPTRIITECNMGSIGAEVVEVRGTLCSVSGGWGDAWDERYYSCTQMTFAGPDLIPAGFGYISPVPSPTVGVPASFGMEIINVGTVSTVTNFINRLRKANDVSGSGATNVATNSAGPLAASAQTSGFSISYTPLATDVGTKYFSICADENLSNVGTINETDETNNCGAWTGVTISNPITYIYSFNSNGGSPTYASVNQVAGSTVNSPGSPTRSGYNFTGWSPTLPTPMPVGGGSSVAQWSLSSPPSVSCTVNPQPSALVGETVTWSATPSGGTPPYSYQWMSVVPSHIPTPAPTTQSFSITYSTIGIKNAYVQVTDSVGQVTQCASPGPSIEIKFNPTFEEF